MLVLILTQQQQASGAVRLRFGTEIAKSSPGARRPSTGLQPLAGVPESAASTEAEAEDEEDDVWGDTLDTVDQVEGDDEDDANQKASEWDIGPEPAGLESHFRFDLKDMKVDKILGKRLDVAAPIFDVVLFCAGSTTRPWSVEKSTLLQVVQHPMCLHF